MSEHKHTRREDVQYGVVDESIVVAPHEQFDFDQRNDPPWNDRSDQEEDCCKREPVAPVRDRNDWQRPQPVRRMLRSVERRPVSLRLDRHDK